MGHSAFVPLFIWRKFRAKITPNPAQLGDIKGINKTGRSLERLVDFDKPLHRTLHHLARRQIEQPLIHDKHGVVDEVNREGMRKVISDVRVARLKI